MKTEAEVRDWMTDLQGYAPISAEQAIGLTGAINACRWVLGETEQGELE